MRSEEIRIAHTHYGTMVKFEDVVQFLEDSGCSHIKFGSDGIIKSIHLSEKVRLTTEWKITKSGLTKVKETVRKRCGV